MPEHYLRVAIAWADPDLLELRVALQFQEWGGADRAYATRDELRTFAAELDALAAGGTEAALAAGQADLGHAALRLREYNRARHLVLDAALGRGSRVGPEPQFAPRELRLSVPVERGQLAGFASALRALVLAEGGEALLALPSDWP